MLESQGERELPTSRYKWSLHSNSEYDWWTYHKGKEKEFTYFRLYTDRPWGPSTLPGREGLHVMDTKCSGRGWTASLADLGQPCGRVQSWVWGPRKWKEATECTHASTHTKVKLGMACSNSPTNIVEHIQLNLFRRNRKNGKRNNGMWLLSPKHHTPNTCEYHLRNPRNS